MQSAHAIKQSATGLTCNWLAKRIVSVGPDRILDLANWSPETGFSRWLCQLALPSRNQEKQIHELSLTALEVRANQGIVFSPTPGYRTNAPPQQMAHTIFATVKVYYDPGPGI